VPALLDQDARDIGGNAEADVDRIAFAKLLRHAPCDHLGDVEFWRSNDDNGREISPEIAGS